MTSLSETRESTAFDIGDEVVARLDGVHAENDVSHIRVPASMLPPWTIGAVTARNDRPSGTSYTLRFQHGDDTLTCVVFEDAIDGLA
jgi:hypothetical protein